MLSSTDREILCVQAFERSLARTRKEYEARKESERWRLEPKQEPEPLPEPSELPWMTVDQVAVWVSVSRRTVYTWIRRKKVVIGRTPSGALRIARASVVTT